MEHDEYERVKKYVECLLGHRVRERKIRAVGVNPLYHRQPKRLIEVGKYYSDLEPGAPREQVLAIFETTLFCVCTPTRGAGHGVPYLFTRESVYRVEEFA